jgi:hypothetical protein
MSITNPIVFDLLFDEEMENQDEMITVVNYGKDMINRICIPQSLMSQRSLGGSSSDGQITVNANIDWDASWGYESPYGIDRFTTAMLRHIAHLLGFGSSVGYRGDNLKFLGVLPTAFDQMILDDEDNLLSLSTNIGNFLSRDIYLQVGNNKYPLFSSGQGYNSYGTSFKYIPLDLSNNNSHQGTYSDYQGVTLDRHKVRYDSNTRHSVIKRIKRRDYDRKTYMRFTY